MTLVAACGAKDRNFPGKQGSGGSAGSGASAGSSGGHVGSSGSAGSGGRVGGSGSGGGNGVAGDSGGPPSGGAAPVDPCVGVACDAPPAASCTSDKEYRTYDKPGSCVEGTCKYTEHLIACACQANACMSDPCQAMPCNSPPAAKCSTSDTLTEYAASGTCSAGSCSYKPTDKSCPFGCANGACKADPCTNMPCSTPPAATCKNTTTKTTYASSGTCSMGSCSYAPTDTACPSNQSCSGQAVCALCKTDTSCGTSCAACSGTTPKCKATSTTSVCVGCLSNADCTDPTTPVCNTSTNACQARPSCIGLAKTCGPSGNQDCCASSIVTGSTFNRGNDPAYPATVSTFRLDKYEVTVGRFRKFAAAYSQNMITSGAGKNPNNSSDPGWNTAWNANLPSDASGLHSQCMGQDSPTWTPSPTGNESLPINCIGWYQAQAFCIWDGGRLPTEAEWNFAAAGGTAQRDYPWGSSPPDCSYANFSTGTRCTTSLSGFNRVGSESPKGDGVFGQSDMAGNAIEWVQDLYQSPYSSTCNNCANLTVGTDRVVRGGYYLGSDTTYATTFNRDSVPENLPKDYQGARCARNP
ncbi:MAG TPA: SUMF1/EgtB/PvdO family nonheme iron enzyme [Polyangiaceae bacterium]|nr:SUMF1/EgtB/PvdO family nonheme iron enzyme [Polyangiaceae bacterium]